MRRTRDFLGCAIAVLALLLAPAAPAAAQNWPQFRGPDRSSVVADDPGLPESWDATENVAWRTPIPGCGPPSSPG